MRQFAQLNLLKPGVSKLESDGGISCIAPGEHTVYADESAALYVECAHGRHYLEGQLSDDYTTLVGMYCSEQEEKMAADMVVLGKYIVKEEDKNINCPLFRELQYFLRDKQICDPEAAHMYAQQFMHNYWLNKGTRELAEKKSITPFKDAGDFS